MKNKSFLIMGNIGSGKSTITNLLSTELNAQEIRADELYKTNPFFKKALEDRKKWSFISDIWFLNKRVKIYKKCLKFLDKKNIVIDSGIPMSLAYAYSRLKSGHFTKQEWDLYKSVFEEYTDTLKIPDIYIFLNSSIDHSMEKINLRGRSFEIKNYTIEYLQIIEESLEFVKDFLSKRGAKVIEVDMNKNDFLINASISDLVKVFDI